MSKQHRIKFQEIYIELSYLCNAECDHCYVSSGPYTDRTRLDPDIVCRVIEESLSLDEISPQVAIAGGEPTLFGDDLLRVIKYAAQRGFHVLLISNGWWGRSLKTCQQKLETLIEHGLTRLEISTSSYHRQFINPAAINNIILLSHDLPIELALHVRFSQSCDLKTNLSFFENLEHVELLRAPVMPVGRAAAKIPNDEFHLAKMLPQGSCHDKLSFLINPRGNCFPCCGGSELSEYLCLGNVYEDSLRNIIERAKERELLYYLTQKGPALIAEMLQADGFNEIANGAYVSICDLCATIFRSQSLATASEKCVQSHGSCNHTESRASCDVTFQRPKSPPPPSTRSLVKIQPRTRPPSRT